MSGESLWTTAHFYHTLALWVLFNISSAVCKPIADLIIDKAEAALHAEQRGSRLDALEAEVAMDQPVDNDSAGQHDQAPDVPPQPEKEPPAAPCHGGPSLLGHDINLPVAGTLELHLVYKPVLDEAEDDGREGVERVVIDERVAPQVPECLVGLFVHATNSTAKAENKDEGKAVTE